MVFYTRQVGLTVGFQEKKLSMVLRVETSLSGFGNGRQAIVLFCPYHNDRLILSTQLQKRFTSTVDILRLKNNDKLTIKFSDAQDIPKNVQSDRENHIEIIVVVLKTAPSSHPQLLITMDKSEVTIFDFTEII